MSKISNSVKIFLTIIVIILIGVGFYYTSYQGKFVQIKKLNEDIQAKNQQLEKERKDVEEIPKLREKRDQLQRKLEALVREKIGSESSKDFVPNYLVQIERMVQEVKTSTSDPSLNLLSLKPGGAVEVAVPGQTKPEEAKSQEQAQVPTALAKFPTRGFDMTMEGRYSTLIYFLQQLGEMKLKRLVTIDRISLSPKETKPGISPVLSINIPVTAYMNQ